MGINIASDRDYKGVIQFYKIQLCHIICNVMKSIMSTSQFSINFDIFDTELNLDFLPNKAGITNSIKYFIIIYSHHHCNNNFC